jgi:phosphoglycerol transferase MdoB-like AlkP superfamily enzyme
VVDEGGILFAQTYASALTAGQSVRGRFSTLCSMLPNLQGAATYLAYPFVDVPCLAEVFRDAGYRTIWLTSAPATYHNAAVFEKAHGTEVFYDEMHFRQRGITERVGDWGLADLPVLEEAIRVLEREAEQGHFFAALTTISSHFPMSVVPEGPLPDPLAEETSGYSEYQGYLSRMIYADRSLSRFFELFLESDLAEDTLVVLLGDHSALVSPHFSLTPVQQLETQFRIPLALITARMPEPHSVSQPVHQVDIAPTLALVAGLPAAEQWLGRGLFAEPAAPWVFLQGAAVHYRTEARACYTLNAESRLRCWDTAAVDPLFEGDLLQVDEDAELTRFFSGLGQAVAWAITHDLLASSK